MSPRPSAALSAVSRTAVLTLRARADEHRRTDRLFADPIAEAWSEELPWPSDFDRWYTPFSQAKTAIRAHQIDGLVQAARAQRPDAPVVELGCGFSTRGARLELGLAGWLGVDLPPVIAARAALGEQASVEAGSVLDEAWMEALPESAAPPIVVAEGLLFYLERSAVDGLLARLGARWPGALLIFDVIGALDFAKSVELSTQVGAPIRWAVEPPFEAAQATFGLAVVPGLEPQHIVAETVALYARRYGPVLGFSLGAVTRLPFLRGRRSGIMAGRLGG